MIPTTTRRSPVYTGTGAPASYAFAFKVFAKSDVAVKVTDTHGFESTWALDAQYTVVLNADQDNFPGGTITPVNALTAGYSLVVIGSQAFNQNTQLPNGGAYNASIVEKAFDRIVVMAQQLAEGIGRALQAPASDGPVAPMPSKAALANKFLAFDANGNPVPASGTGADAGLRTDLAATTGSALAGHDDFSGASVRDSLHFFMRTIQPLRKYLPASVDYDAILAGTSTEDHTAYLRDAYTHTNKIELPDGRVNISDSIDLRPLNSMALIGVGKGRWSGAGTVSVAGSQVMHTGANKPGFRLSSRFHVEGIAAEYSAQQPVGNTSAVMFEFSGTCRHPIMREVVAAYGQTNFGILQSGVSVFFDALVEAIEAWGASGVPMDFRNFGGGGTNSQFQTIYINGLMPLDRSAAGQSATYAMRLGNGSGYTVQGVSIDGLTVTGSDIIDLQGGDIEVDLRDFRFEACDFTNNTVRVFNCEGNYGDAHIEGAVFQNSRWIPAAAASFFVYASRATRSHFRAGPTFFRDDCNLGAVGSKRLLFNSASLLAQPDARVHIGHLTDETTQMDATSWTDSTAVQRDMAVFEFNGRKVKEILQGGRTGKRPMVEYLDALPADGARNVGDIVVITRDANADAKPTKYEVITAGTPGTFRAVEGVVGMGTTAQRPVLTASDVGWGYLDTTLAAAGKRITWNGTSWVDATGTIV